MDFKEKFIRYHPDITSEVFQLIWDKLIGLGWKGNRSCEEEYSWFKQGYNYLEQSNDEKTFGAYSVNAHSKGFTEITPEELLGYDPFIKPIESEEEYPEYYEFIGNSSSFTKGKIYKINNPKNLEEKGNFIDDKGEKNGYCGNNYELFKPSTKEAFDLQIKPKQIESKMNYKFKVGDKLRIVEAGWGCSEECIGDIVEVLELGEYFNGPGYETIPTKGRSNATPINNDERKHGYNNIIGEDSFELASDKPIGEFKAGDYIVFTKGVDTQKAFPLNYVFKQRANSDYLRPCLDAKGSKENGWECYRNFNKAYKSDFTNKTIITDWRYATEEEIAEYERLGKPYDVTTLNKSIESSFVVGKWYKGEENDQYIKFHHIQRMDTYDRIHYRERIYDGIYTLREDYWANKELEEYALNHPVDLSEIQRYLPDGHPDKINSNNVDLTGRWIKCLDGTAKGHYPCKTGDYLKYVIEDVNKCQFWGAYNLNKGNDGTNNPRYWGKNVHLNPHFELMPIGFEPNQDNNMESILEEAKRRYPAGTKFHPVHTGTKKVIRDFIYTTRDNGFIVFTFNGPIISNNGNLYVDGVWAEIVQSENPAEPIPQKEPTKLILNIDEEDLPMISIKKHNTVKSINN